MDTKYLKRTFQKILIWLSKSPLFWIVSAPVILFAPIILTGKSLFWGVPLLQFIPWRHLAWEIIASGEIPLWNPYVGMGAPLLANYQSAIFYPPNWLLFLLDGIGGVSWLAWGHTLLVVFHLVIAGSGIVKLNDQLGFSKLGQTISGLSFSMCLYLVARAGFFTIISTAAWLPWILCYCIPIKSSRKLFNKKNIILSILFALLLLAGHAQTAFYVVLFSLAWYLFWRIIAIDQFRIKTNSANKAFLFDKDNLSYIFSSLAQFALAFLIGLLLASVQIIPTIEYLSLSYRATSVDFNTAMTYSFWPWRFLTLAAPDIFGNPATGNYWGYGNYWEDAVYIGFLPLVASAIALFSTKRFLLRSSNKLIIGKLRSLMIFLLVTMVISAMIALGNHTPFFPYLYKAIPPFGMFQAPTRISLLIVFALAFLAGWGVDIWQKPEGRSLYWNRLAVAGAFAITIGAVLAWIVLGGIIPTFVKSLAKMGILAVISSLLFLYKPMIPNEIGLVKNYSEADPFYSKDVAWKLGMIIFVFIDLVWAGWGLNPSATLSLDQTVAKIQALKNMLNEGRFHLVDEDEYALKYKHYFQFNSFLPDRDWTEIREILLPNTFILDHITSTNNFDPLVPARYRKWMDTMANRSFPSSVYIESMMNLSNIRLVERISSEHDVSVQFNVREGGKRFWWFVCGTRVESEKDALDLLLGRTWNVTSDLIYEYPKDTDYPKCDQSRKINQQANIAVIVREDKFNHQAFEVNTASPGFLLISEAWYPGWTAIINGKPSPVLRANYLFKALFLREGNNQIVINYQPVSFYLGSILSGLSIIGLVIFVLVIKRNAA